MHTGVTGCLRLVPLTLNKVFICQAEEWETSQGHCCALQLAEEKAGGNVQRCLHNYINNILFFQQKGKQINILILRLIMELKDVQGCFFSNHHVQLCTFLIYSHCILVHFSPRPLFSITIILNVHFIKFKFY